MVHIILEPAFWFIPLILKEFFDFIDRLDKFWPKMLLSTCNIKSLCKSINQFVPNVPNLLSTDVFRGIERVHCEPMG